MCFDGCNGDCHRAPRQPIRSTSSDTKYYLKHSSGGCCLHGRQYVPCKYCILSSRSEAEDAGYGRHLFNRVGLSYSTKVPLAQQIDSLGRKRLCKVFVTGWIVQRQKSLAVLTIARSLYTSNDIFWYVPYSRITLHYQPLILAVKGFALGAFVLYKSGNAHAVIAVRRLSFPRPALAISPMENGGAYEGTSAYSVGGGQG